MLDSIKYCYVKAMEYGYRGFDYSLYTSSAAGATNGSIEYLKGNEFKPVFGVGMINHMVAGVTLSMFYPLVLDWCKNSNHPRLFANTFHISIVLFIFIFCF